MLVDVLKYPMVTNVLLIKDPFPVWVEYWKKTNF